MAELPCILIVTLHVFFVSYSFVLLQDGDTPLDILKQESDYSEEQTERRRKCLQLLQVISSVSV